MKFFVKGGFLDKSLCSQAKHERTWNNYWKTKNTEKFTLYEKEWYPYLGSLGYGSVIEIGCGSGRGLSKIKARRKVGVDIVSGSIKLAKKNCTEGEFFCIDGTRNLPFKDKEFDLLVSSGLLEHFEPLSKRQCEIIKEWSRIAKELLIVVPNKYCLFYWFWRLGKTFMGKWDCGFERPLSKKELLEIFKKSNLKVIDHRMFVYNYAHSFRVKPDL